jgi:hypothetical protein
MSSFGSKFGSMMLLDRSLNHEKLFYCNELERWLSG